MKQTKILIALLTLGLAGCATSSKVEVDAESAKYAEGVRTISLKSVNEATCPNSSTSWTKEHWKKQMDMANACVKARRWVRLEQIANHLAQAEHLSAWGSYYLSLAAEARKDYPRAMWMVDLGIKKNPGLGILRYQKARLLWREERHQAAMDEFTTSIKLKANVVDSHLFLAQIYHRDQDYSQAADHYEAVLKAEPQNIVSLEGLAEINLLEEDGKAALEFYNRALAHQPNNLSFRVRVAYIYEVIEKDYEQALRAYQRVRSLMGNKNIESAGVNVNEKIKALEATVNGAKGQDKVSRRDTASEEPESKKVSK